MKLWRSGIFSGVFWSVLGFLAGLGNFFFSAMMARWLTKEELGLQASALNFVNFLTFPLAATAIALVHYIAHFRGHNDEARLQGLFAGCEWFLIKATLWGSVGAIVLAAPLGSFFGFRSGLMIAAVACVLVGLWSGFSLALCQGMSWFKRLAVAAVCAVMLRILFGWVTVKRWPTAEVALTATTFSFLANLSLLFWARALFRKGVEKISPWTREFLAFWVVALACTGGNWFFTQGDALAAKRHFGGDALGLYTVAGQFGRAIPWSVGPLLQVVFTSRSGKRSQEAATDQRVLLALYAAGLVCAALGLTLLRGFLVHAMFGKVTPESAAMVPRFAAAMVFASLSQAIGTWALASRWFKVALLYGGLGLAYWLALLAFGLEPDKLLNTMVVGTVLTFVILCATWLAARRAPVPATSAPNPP